MSEEEWEEQFDKLVDAIEDVGRWAGWIAVWSFFTMLAQCSGHH